MPEPTQVLPEVLGQIRALPVSRRPLIVCDVDEVVLHLIAHLEDYLHARDLMFLKHEYRLTGNIGTRNERRELPAADVRRHLQVFFDEICPRQDLVPGADEALHALVRDWDIVLLTNLPGGHNKPVREKRLAEMGMTFPVLTNSGPKGGAVAALAAGRPAPVVFIDDSPTNHSSVHASLPSAIQIQFIADARFRETVDPAGHVSLVTGDWQETSAFIGGIVPGARRPEPAD